MTNILRALVRITSSTPRVFLSGCSKARFAGNSGAIAKNSNAAAAAQEQPNVEIILTRVLSLAGWIALLMAYSTIVMQHVGGAILAAKRGK